MDGTCERAEGAARLLLLQRQLFPSAACSPRCHGPFPQAPRIPVQGVHTQPVLEGATQSSLLLLLLPVALGAKTSLRESFEGLQVAKGSHAPSLCHAIASYSGAAELGQLSACTCCSPG